MKVLLALIILFFNCLTDVQLAPAGAFALFRTFDFVMVSAKPGAVVAFRLKKNHADDKATVCFRQECLAASRQWKLLATDPDGPQKQIVLLEDEVHHYAFRKIALERIETSVTANEKHGPAINLRLPASVTNQLAEEGSQMVTDQTEDHMMFSRSSPAPWSSQWLPPVRNVVTSDFASWRVPPNGTAYMHTGADLRAASGTSVRASSDGVVIQAAEHVVEGRVVTIDHGGGLMSRYAHLSQYKVKVGDQVKTGDLIGLSGTTGRSEVPHLHFEMRVRGKAVDPLSTLRLMARLSYLE